MTARWVVMGVSGSGKSCIGAALADALGVRFVEGDDYHSPANIAKMRAGVPLTDADRAAWLASLAAEIARAATAGQGLVLSCSALRRRYRDRLRAADPGLRFAHIHGERALFAQRMQARSNHFMPPSLLDSQLAALEPLQADEAGLTLDARLSPAELVNEIRGQV
ncbi:gluconokinase [Pseudoduganella sp.]|uniref:gluconokinase n=1 Tax=Pseudoduganella sp. TaxID=1880898 RepID=UPI0035AE5C7C